MLIVFAALGVAAPLRAQDETSALLASLANVDPDLQTYRADVAFDVGLHSFPYLRRTLHGNAYFKRPARMEVVFRDLPSFARGWSKLYVGLGTPSDWERKFTIGSAADPSTAEHAAYLVLTPRIADRRLREVDVFVDRSIGLPERIVWRYRDGQIDMHQLFGRVDGHDLIVAQNADIPLPAVHAFVHTHISNYAINVDVDDALFTKKPEPRR